MDSTFYPHFSEAIQGDLGSCYAMAAMSAVAAYPDIMDPIFLTKTKNAAGIAAVQIFIRGKPWVIDVDS